MIYTPATRQTVKVHDHTGQALHFVVDAVEITPGEPGCDDEAVAYLSPVRLVPPVTLAQ